MVGGNESEKNMTELIKKRRKGSEVYNSQTNLLICRNCKRIAPDSDWLQASDGENACVECFSRSVEELDETVAKDAVRLKSLLRIGLTMLLGFSLGVAFALPWLFTNEEIAENAFTFWRAF